MIMSLLGFPGKFFKGFFPGFLKTSEKKKVQPAFTKHEFGRNFSWGVAISAFQTEGAWNTDNKGPSIWDVFTQRRKTIKNGDNAMTAVDFYNRYESDIGLIRKMHFNAFRFSLSWPRIIPEGTGSINARGTDYYHRVIDACLENGIEPWITLYHWDLPQALEDKGGWTNRDIIDRFANYADVCTRTFGDKVKKWMILNEPMSFTGLGYYTGYHAPGRKGLRNFLPAAHHAALCQSEGGRIARYNVDNAFIGTTFSFSHIKPVEKSERHIKAAERLDALLNRFFLEPALGLGYPFDTLPALRKIEKYVKPGDASRLAFDFDFYGVQYYFRLISAFSPVPPVLFAREIPAEKRGVLLNQMGFEVYPKGLYKILKKLSQYPQIKNMVITESGVCFEDRLKNGRIPDMQRQEYLMKTQEYTLKAIRKGMPVSGYFVWSLTDNFEWSEGFDPRFGLVYIDYHDLQRYLKDSGVWFGEFLTE